MTEQERNENVVFAIADVKDTVDGIPVLILGIPKPCWERIKEGLTSCLDLQKAGLPLKVVIFGGESHQSIVATLKAYKGPNFADRTSEDFNIK